MPRVMLTLTKQAKSPQISGFLSCSKWAACWCAACWRNRGSPLQLMESISASHSRPSLASHSGAEELPQLWSWAPAYAPAQRQVPLQSHYYCSTDTAKEDSSGHRPRLQSCLCFFLGSRAVSSTSELCSLSPKQLFTGLGKFRKGYLSYLKFVEELSFADASALISLTPQKLHYSLKWKMIKFCYHDPRNIQLWMPAIRIFRMLSHKTCKS